MKTSRARPLLPLALLAAASALASIVVDSPSRPASARHRTLLPARVPKNLNDFLSLAPSADAGSFALSGRVRGSDGGAVAGATVTAVQPDDQLLEALNGYCYSDIQARPETCGCGDNQPLLEKRLDLRLTQPRIIARTTTDDAGGFRFERLPHPVHDLWVDAPGWTPAQAQFGVTDIRLERPIMLRGQVVNEADEPIGGAVVSLMRGGRLFDAVTDGDGGYVLGPVPRNGTLVARRTGFLAVSTYASDERRFRLPDPRELSGTVSRNGRPVADAGVQIVSNFMPRSCVVTTRTDAAGHYRVNELLPTAYEVTADEGSNAARVKVLVDGLKEASVLDLALTPHARVRGGLWLPPPPPKPRAWGGPEPCGAWSSVELWADWMERPEFAPLDGDGGWRSSPLPPGRYTIAASCNHAAFGPIALELDGGAELDLGLNLGGGSPLVVTLLDAKGRVVARPDFLSAVRSHPKLSVVASAVERDDGTQTFHALSPGTWVIEAETRDPPGSVETTIEMPRDQPLTLTAGPMATLQISLRRAGKPTGPPGVQVERADPPSGQRSQFYEPFADQRRGQVQVPPGRYQVLVSTSGGHTLHYVDAASGKTTRVQVSLAGKASRGGRVLWADGSALGQASLEITDRPDGGAPLRYGAWSYTDAEGRFGIDGLPAGTYYVSVKARAVTVSADAGTSREVAGPSGLWVLPQGTSGKIVVGAQ